MISRFSYFTLFFLSSSIAFAIGKIPFVYLNQYFNFSITSDSEISISEQVLNFGHLQFELTADQIKVELKDLDSFSKSEISVFLKDSSSKKISSQKSPIISNQAVFLSKNSDFDMICFEFRSQFSNLQACKKLSPLKELGDFQPRVLINGQLFQKAGIVVLKNKDEDVLFQAQLSENNGLELRTRKRSIVPKSITKNADQENFKVIFQDLEANEKLSWQDSVNINQSFFNIELDPILILKQDIYFTGARLKESASNYVRSDVKKSTGLALYLHNTTIEPFGLYLGAIGSSSKLNVSLSSDLGKGIKIDHRWRLDKHFDGQAEGYGYQTSIVADSANLLNNTSQFFFSAGGGLTYHSQDNFEWRGEFIIRKDLFFKIHEQTTNVIDIVSGLNKILTLTPSWTFYKSVNAAAGVELGLHYLLPTTADTEAIQAGSSFQFGLNYSYEFDFGHLKFETYYLRRTQNTQTFNFAEQTAFYGLGYQYFF